LQGGFLLNQSALKYKTVLLFLNVWSFLHQTHITVLATCGQAFKSHSLLWKKWTNQFMFYFH